MTVNLHTALQNIKDIYMSKSAVETLLSFERVIDELDVYVFENWKIGDLVEGPIYEKYFVTATFMWPYKKMPDPRGGEQLLNYNCEVLYKKSKLEYPIKPKNPDDFKPGTKVGKKTSVPIWLVSITIPKKLMDDIQKGAIEIEGENLELDDVQRAYDEGAEEDENANEEQGQMDPMGQMDQGMGAPNPAMNQPPMNGGM